MKSNYMNLMVVFFLLMNQAKSQALPVQFVIADEDPQVYCNCNQPLKRGDSLMMEITLPESDLKAKYFYVYVRNGKNARLHRERFTKKDILYYNGESFLRLPIAVGNKRGKTVRLSGDICRRKKNKQMWVELIPSRFPGQVIPHVARRKTDNPNHSELLEVQIEKGLPPNAAPIIRGVVISSIYTLTTIILLYLTLFQYS